MRRTLALVAACSAPALPPMANTTTRGGFTVTVDVDHTHGPCRWSGPPSQPVFDAVVAKLLHANPGATVFATDDTAYRAIERKLARQPREQETYLLVSAHDDGGAVYGWHAGVARAFCFEVAGGSIRMHEVSQVFTD